jgi:hypothetical protein
MSTTRLIRRPVDAPVTPMRPTGLSGMLGLLERLDTGRWYTLPDLAWTGRPPGTHGRVVIGPTGVFLLTDHPWAGAVSVHDQELRVDGRSRDLYVGDAVEAAASVAALLPVDLRAHVHAVLCLTRQGGLDLVSRARRTPWRASSPAGRACSGAGTATTSSPSCARRCASRPRAWSSRCGDTRGTPVTGGTGALDRGVVLSGHFPRGVGESRSKGT